MVNLIISFVIATLAAVMPWTVFAKDVDFARADQLIKRYNTNAERPKSCPLASTKFSELIAKTEAIKDTFKGNCQKKDGDKMTEVLESIKGIQDELKNKSLLDPSKITDLAINSSSSSSSSGSSGVNGQLSGLKFSALFSNITSMFKKNQCNLDDGRVLSQAADLIYDSTQLGVLSGNQLGLIVAGAGFVVSSALRLIDLIFKQRFNFEKTIDRQTFIKLNCSFYEIRRELDMHGVMDVENSFSREDYRDVLAIIDDLSGELKKLEEEKINTGKSYSELDRKVFEENIGNLTEFKNTLSKIKKYLEPGLTTEKTIPTETQKLLMISMLAQDYDLLVTQLDFYKKLKLSSIPMLDDLFLNEMKKFDPLDVNNFMQTMNVSAIEFNENHRARILFNIIRISNDIEKKENKLSSENQLAKNDLIKTLDLKMKDYTEKLVELKKVEARLGNIVAPTEYSGLDDGSENLVAILDNHTIISEQIYGEWGEKFLRFSSQKSIDEVKSFNERLASFNIKYSSLIKSGKTENVQMSYLCQDAQKLRFLYRNADSLVQEGFDFIVTNKDLFYSDNVKENVNSLGKGGRGDYSKSGKMGIATYNSSVEKIQSHYKSTILALRKIKGEEVSDGDVENYLDKSMFGNLYIGKAMLDVSNVKAQTKYIQDVYDRLGCQKSLANELH